MSTTKNTLARQSWLRPPKEALSDECIHDGPITRVRVVRDPLSGPEDLPWALDAVWESWGAVFLSQDVHYFRTHAEAIAAIPSFMDENGFYFHRTEGRVQNDR
jgi:hypothetical protein